jgi:UDP:flavonoid glycosyltransferase YjiC (YdhE family)
VNDAILHGLPILITPIAYDHFHTAALVEKAGCGRSIRYKRMRVGDLWLTVNQLLKNNSYRTAAERTRDSFLRAGGSEKAAMLLEETVVFNKISA